MPALVTRMSTGPSARSDAARAAAMPSGFGPAAGRSEGAGEFRRGFLDPCAIEIPERDLRPRADEALSDREADAARAAGDRGDATLQIDLVHLVGSSVVDCGNI